MSNRTRHGARFEEIPASGRVARTVWGWVVEWGRVAVLVAGVGVAAHEIGWLPEVSPSLFRLSSASEPVKRTGTIVITSLPTSVGVLMEGQFIGVTPIRFDWPAGFSRLVLKLHGYLDLVTMVKVEEGKTQELDLSLFPVGLATQNLVAPPSPGLAAESAPEGGAVGDPAGGSPANGVLASPSQGGPPPSASEVKPILPEGERPVVDVQPQSKPRLKVKKEESREESREEIVQESPTEPSPPAKEEGEIQTDKKPFPPRPATPPAALATIMGGRGEASAAVAAGDKVALDRLNLKYAIQVGAFMDRESAGNLALYWKKKGYDTYILELWGTKDPTRLWQSVRIGSFKELARARAAMEAFMAWEQVDCYLARWDSFAGPSAEEEAESQAVVEADSDAGADAAPVGDLRGDESGPGEVVGPVEAETLGERGSVGEEPRAEESLGLVSSAQAVPSGAPRPLDGEENDEDENLDEEEWVSGVAPEVAASAVTTDGGEKSAPVASDGEAVPAGNSMAVVVTPIDQGAAATLQPEAAMVGDSMAVVVTPIDQGVSAATSPEAATVGSPATTHSETATARDTLAVVVTPIDQGGATTTNPQGVLESEEEEILQPPTPTPVPLANIGPKNRTISGQDPRQDRETRFQEAGRLRDRGALEQAETLLQQILLEDSHHGRARRRLARIYVQSGKVDKALAVLREGVAGRSSAQLSQDDPNLAAFLAALYQRDEDHWQAIDLYENLLRRYPDKGVWQMGLAISLERVNEPGDALHAYRAALSSGDLSDKLQAFVKKRVRELQ